MGDGAAYNYIAMADAIADAGLEEKDVSNERTGLITGSGGISTKNLVAAADIARAGSPKTRRPLYGAALHVQHQFGNAGNAVQNSGVNYSITSACATSAHCIGNAAEMIEYGKQDIMFAGGGEELDWSLTVLFDAMGALSSKYNDAPEKASRAYDEARDGFVIAGGGGTLVLEELEHAKSSRRENLRRNHRLRPDFGRL